jgi:DNA mismatch repair ATPase MutS
MGLQKSLNFKTFGEIGKVLKYFYEIYDNKEYNDAFLYSFGFNGYIDVLDNFKKHIENKSVNITEFTKNKEKTILFNSYYAVLYDKKPVRNNVKLNKNLIVTGPNASGKTTVIKSTLINIIFSQQFGYGFFEKAKIYPYKYIHCYLNIPDTSGRDSLFQAEARRCKDIIDCISTNNKDRHFCVFDELYSGTNPYEATVGGYAMMNYLSKIKNVNCLLTTHYIKLCEKLRKNDNIKNYNMKTIQLPNGDFEYTYIMSPGISNKKGGFKVLEDMNYPREIIQEIKGSF